MYKLQNNGIKRLSDNAYIPLSDGNRDYEEYKVWLSEGNVPLPQYTEEELAQQASDKAIAEARQAKELALSTITVTTTSGKVFDGREKDVSLMSGAIQAAEVLGLSEHQWKLHDNTVAVVTLAELKEALALAMVAIGTLKVGG